MEVYVATIDGERHHVVASSFEEAMAAARTWWASPDQGACDPADVPLESLEKAWGENVIGPDGRELTPTSFVPPVPQ